MGKGKLGRYCEQNEKMVKYPNGCGRSGGEKRKNYPKCVPIAKARRMTKGQACGCVARKQAKANTGPTAI